MELVVYDDCGGGPEVEITRGCKSFWQRCSSRPPLG